MNNPMNHLGNRYSTWQQIVGGVGVTVVVMTTVSGTAPISQAQAMPASVSEGYALLERGWVSDAIGAFRQAIQQYPQSVEARLGLAIAYQRNGQDAEAWATYQQLLEQDPNNQAALTAVGMLGSYRPEWQRSGIAALTTLLEQTPQNQEARAQRALLYGYQGQFANAIADYDVLLADNPAPDVLLGAAQVYTYSGNYPQGVALFEQYLAEGGTLSNDVIAAYALALQETGRPDSAVEVLASRLQSFRTVDATAIQIRAALAIAYQKTDRLDAALATLEPLRHEPAATLAMARALSAIGRAENDNTVYADAVALYRQVLEQTPTASIGLQTEIADVFSEYAMTHPQALMLYDQLLAQQPTDQSLQIKRLVVSQRLGQISRDELDQQLQTVLQNLPSDAVTQRSIAQALIRVDPPAPKLLPVYQVLAQAGADPFLDFRIAQIYLRQSDLEAAKQALTSYLASPVGAQDYAPELLLADIERREGNLDASAQRYEGILAANPTARIRTDAQRGLAGIRLAQGQLNAALTIYDRLLAANPDDLASQLGQASIRYQTQQMSDTEAEAVLDRWLRTEPVPEPPPELFSLVGALPPAIVRQPLYESLLTVEPDHVAVNRRLVQVLATIDPDRARTHVAQLVQDNPGNLNAYFVQAELAQALGDLDWAGQSYERILQQQPDRIDALSALGGVRFQQRRYAEATQLYNQVLTLRPDDWETHRVLAELSAAQDQPYVAIDELRQVQQRQTETGETDARVDRRIRQLQVDVLRRRGFQPAWERY